MAFLNIIDNNPPKEVDEHIKAMAAWDNSQSKIDYWKYWLNNSLEYDYMVKAKEQWFTSDEFKELLEKIRIEQEDSYSKTKKQTIEDTDSWYFQQWAWKIIWDTAWWTLKIWWDFLLWLANWAKDFWQWVWEGVVSGVWDFVNLWTEIIWTWLENDPLFWKLLKWELISDDVKNFWTEFKWLTDEATKLSYELYEDTWNPVDRTWVLNGLWKLVWEIYLSSKIPWKIEWSSYIKRFLRWITEWSKFWAVSWWEPEDVVTWALTWGLLWPVVEYAWEGIAKWLKTLGNKIFKSWFTPNKQEAWAILDELAGKWSKKPTVWETAFEKEITWTQKSIWVKWIQEADTLWTNEIQPLLGSSKQRINKFDMFQHLEKWIKQEAEAWRRWLLEKALDKLKQEYTDEAENFTLQQAQNIKSWLDKFTPAKAFKWEDITAPYSDLKHEMANYLRGNIHNKLSTEFWVNSANNYATWANLSKLRDVWIKWIQTWWEWFLTTPWGSQTLISEVYNQLMTPIKTKWWLTLYKVWDYFTVIWPTWLKTFQDYLFNLDEQW